MLLFLLWIHIEKCIFKISYLYNKLKFLILCINIIIVKCRLVVLSCFKINQLRSSFMFAIRLFFLTTFLLNHYILWIDRPVTYSLVVHIIQSANNLLWNQINFLISVRLDGVILLLTLIVLWCLVFIIGYWSLVIYILFERNIYITLYVRIFLYLILLGSTVTDIIIYLGEHEELIVIILVFSLLRIFIKYLYKLVVLSFFINFIGYTKTHFNIWMPYAFYYFNFL